jgi:hypothetical protein
MISHPHVLDAPARSAPANMEFGSSMPKSAIRSPSTANSSETAPAGLMTYVPGDFGSVLPGATNSDMNAASGKIKRTSRSIRANASAPIPAC